MTATTAPVAMVNRFADRWQRFWFTPVSASVLTLQRVLIGVVSLAWAASILPDLRAFYFSDGLLGDASYAEYRLGLFQWFTSDGAAVAVFVSLVIAAALVTWGRLVRLAAPVLWVTMLTLQQAAPEALNAGDMCLRIWCAWFALFAVCTPSRFVSAPLRGSVGPDGLRRWPTAPGWFVRVAQIQLSLVYPATAVAKLDGDTWRQGTAALYALGLRDFERFWLPDLVRENLVLGNLMTWVTIGLEMSLAFLLWTRRTRWFGIIAGLGMHVGFDYTMRLGFFLPAMAIGYLSFVQPRELERAYARVVRRIRAEGPGDAVAPAP